MRTGSCLSIIMLAAGSFLGVSASALADGACCTITGCEPAADEAACTALGGFFLPGESCDDDACGVGACCSPDSCVEAEAYPCFFAGRDYLGVGTTCLEDACEIGIGACCNAGACSEIAQQDCETGGGTWLGGGTHCFNDPCDLGSCCAPGTCNDSARFECENVGGAFIEGIGCDADGCDVEFGCPLDSIYSQTRSTPFAFEALTSEASAGFQRWDDYSGAAGAIEELRWWGLDLEFGNGNFPECVESNNEFQISFHEDVAGFPGAAVCSYTLLAMRTPTGILYQERELNEYAVTLPQPCVLVNGWISILGLGDADCWFLWMSSPDGDDRSICNGCQQEEQQSDLSFCLIGTFGEVFGACCDQSTAECTDGTEITDCLAPGARFEPDMACVDLDPGCAVVSGACCFENGDCFQDLATACTAAGGNWLGAETTCTLCPEMGACCVGFDSCLATTELDCFLEGYNWLGADTTCDDCPGPPECPANSQFSQLPDDTDDFEAGTSEVSSPFRRWENFLGVAGAIESLRWWGLDLENIPDTNNFIECTEVDNTFEITFHTDAGGLPGAEVCSYTLLATRTPTGFLYLGTEMNEYEVTLPVPCVLVDGWVSIAGLGDPTCWFLWMSSGLGESYCEGCIPNEQALDLGVCLNGSAGGVFGACCDDSTGECNDEIEITDCAKPGQRFAADELCDNLDPPCGVINGACCFGNGTCESGTSEACAAAGGDWLGANTPCSACPCVTPCPANGIPEGEPVCTDNYLDEFNGGCDAKTQSFSPISMCDAICGKGGVFAVGPELVPEFDWYEITLDVATELSWTVESEFPILAAIVDGNAGCAGAEVLVLDVAQECTPLTVSFELEPGTYWLVAGASGTSDLAVCGARYTARVTGSGGECACLEDLDGSGAVGAFDLALLLGAWGPCAECSADINGDGAVGAFDLALLLGAWGSCS